MSTPTDYAARTRAARGHADLDQQTLAERLSISVRTLARMESGERPPGLEERQAIAAACDVPAMFMEVGFAPLQAPMGQADQAVHSLQAQFIELRAAVIELAGGNLRQTRRLLGMDETDRPAGSEG